MRGGTVEPVTDDIQEVTRETYVSCDRMKIASDGRSRPGDGCRCRGTGTVRPEPELQKVAIAKSGSFSRANQSGRKESASELTFFLGGAADEAAIARDAGTRDGGQRYWGGK